MTVVTGDSRYAMPDWIVDANGLNQGATHTTIQAAVNDASSGDLIAIRGGTYTEDVTLADGLTVIGYPSMAGGDKPKVVGKFSLSSGGALLVGLELETNSDFCVSTTGTGSINCNFCTAGGTDNTVLSQASSGILRFEYGSIKLSTTGVAAYTHSAGDLAIRRCSGSNTSPSTTAADSSSGEARIEYCNVPWKVSCSSSGFFNIKYSTFEGETNNLQVLSTAGTGTSSVKNCELQSGSSAAVSIGTGTTVSISNSVISSTNSNPITGAGTVVYSGLSFSSTGNGIDTSTQTERAMQLGNALANQISFDSGSNNLSNYEEGTWTPTVIGTSTPGTATYTEQNGWYQRIGNKVYFSFRVNYNSGNGSGNLIIDGLPFTSSSTKYGDVVSVNADGGLGVSASVDQVSGSVISNSTQIALQEWIYNTSLSAVAYDAQAIVQGTGVYSIN